MYKDKKKKGGEFAVSYPLKCLWHQFIPSFIPMKRMNLTKNRVLIENKYLPIKYKIRLIVRTSALIVLFTLMPSRNAVELQTVW